MIPKFDSWCQHTWYNSAGLGKYEVKCRTKIEGLDLLTDCLRGRPFTTMLNFGDVRLTHFLAEFDQIWNIDRQSSFC